MSGLEKNMVSSVAVSGNIAIFVVPNFHIAVESFDLSVNRFNTAGSFRCISSGDSGMRVWRLKRKGLASFVISILKTFAHMPNSSKSSQPAKNSNRATHRKAVQGAVSAQKTIYKVSIHALGPFATEFRSGIYISDIFEADNEDEAIGMACKNIKQRFPLHSIVAEKINVSLLNPLRK